MAAIRHRLDALLATPEPAALGPGPRAGRQSIPHLERALKTIFDTVGPDPAPRDLIRALVLLWHDHLEAAHALAQDAPTPDGSFIHGILHRREPDYGNAKYWFHRAGPHAAFPAVARRASALPAAAAGRALLGRFCPKGDWDPFAFIDCCQEEATAPSGQEAFLRPVQQAEFSALLEHLAALL